MAQDPRVLTGIGAAALRTFGLFLQPGDSIADLGCLHGMYAAVFAAAGYQVTGVEARQSSYDTCLQLAPVPGLRFARDDARNLAAYGEFDGVFCCGLLYHLDEPDAFLQMLGKVTRKVLIIQSHYAAVPAAVHEGRRGRWVPDNPQDEWGSAGNTRSFWMAKPDLLQAIADAGFAVVVEQHDYRQNIAAGLYTDHFGRPEQDRGMFAGVRA